MGNNFVSGSLSQWLPDGDYEGVTTDNKIKFNNGAVFFCLDKIPANLLVIVKVKDGSVTDVTATGKSDKQDVIEFRAALKQIAKGLELQRSGVLAAVAYLDKKYNLKGEYDGRKESIAVSDKVPMREDIR